MAKKEFTYDIVEIVHVFPHDPDAKWGKVLIRVSWNDAPVVYDIRSCVLASVDFDEPNKLVFQKGVSLDDDALDDLIEVLISEGFGNPKRIKKLLNKRNEDEDNFYYVPEKRIMTLRRY